MRITELKQKIWKQANSLVITVPKQMMAKEGDIVRITTDGHKMEVVRDE